MTDEQRETLTLLLEGHPEDARGWTVALRAVIDDVDRVQNIADVRGNMLRYIAFVTTGDETGDAQLGVDRLKAENERLRIEAQAVADKLQFVTQAALRIATEMK